MVVGGAARATTLFVGSAADALHLRAVLANKHSRSASALKAQYDLSIGLMLMSVTSAVQGRESALTTTLAMSSGCSSTSG